MTPDQVVKEIETYFETNWTTTTIVYSNIPILTDISPNQTWVRISIKLGQVFEGEIGRTGLSERVGIIIIDIFVPLNIGTRTAWQYAGQIETFFRKSNISGVECGEPYSEEPAGEENDSWKQISVTIPFFAWVGE